MAEIPSISASFKGSLTVETAIALPLFLFAMMGFMMLIEATRFSGNMQASLHQAARKLTNYSYAASYLPGHEGIGGGAAGKIVSMTAGKSITLDDIGRDYVEDSPVENGCSGLSFIHSHVMGADQMIDLAVVYKIRTDLPILGSPSFKAVDRARIRAFTGYDNTGNDDRDDTDEEIVYVAENGVVYHRNRNCSHLALVIRETNHANVGTERNSAGGKYYPCEYCGKKAGNGEDLFIAEDGDRWHTKVTCPGLKRTIRAVPLSEAGGLPPCSDCGR